jgi:Mor family transcriptional regulator
MNTRERFTRNNRIVEQYNTGMTADAIAEANNVTAATVYHILREAREIGGVTIRRQVGRRPTNQERNAEIVSLYKEGRTLEAIGGQYNLSRERVRQIVKRSGIETYGKSVSAYRRWVSTQGEEVNATFTRTRSVADTIAAHPEVPHAWVKRLLRPRHHESIRGRRPSPKIWEDQSIFAALHAASRDGIVTAASYSRWRREGNTIDGRTPPTSTLITWRFGSWRDAVEKAGLQAGRSSRSTYERTWTRDDAIAAVRRYIAEATERGVRPTYAHYDAWVSENPGHPSGAYLRHLTNQSWSELLIDALRAAA